MDLILGDGTSKRFRQAWMDCVPFIISAAKSTNTKSVNTLLKSFKNLDDDFGENTSVFFKT